MQEIMMNQQLLENLSLQDTNELILPPQLDSLDPLQQPNQQNRRAGKKGHPKKSSLKTEANLEAELTSLKNEIEYMPMKTPISILQELLSRRGESKSARHLLVSIVRRIFYRFSAILIISHRNHTAI